MFFSSSRNNHRQRHVGVAVAVLLLLIAQAQSLNDNGTQGSHLRKKKNKNRQHFDNAKSRPEELKRRLNFHDYSDTIPEDSTNTNTTTTDESEMDEMDDRIVGGTNAAAGEFPFFVQGRGCGASLIWYDVALTAAHCYGTPFNGNVYIGNYIRNSVQGGGLTRSVLQQVPHPNFSRNTMNNDFMLIKLSSEVPRTGTIQPIQINSATNTPASNDPLKIVGFGITAEGSSTIPNNLMKALVNYVDSNTCSSNYDGRITPSLMLCAAARGKDTCQGDSGGPILNAAGVQVGVTSYGEGCARVGKPGIYSRTSGGYSWIRSQVCLLSSNPPAYCGSTSSGNGNGGGTSTSTMHTVVITVQLDQFPEETLWALTNSRGQVLASQAAFSVTTDRALVQRTLSLPAGTYTFTIADVYGDGICCAYGNGYINIKVDGVTVATGNGLFTTSFQRQFTIGGTRSFDDNDNEQSFYDEETPARKPKPPLSEDTSYGARAVKPPSQNQFSLAALIPEMAVAPEQNFGDNGNDTNGDTGGDNDYNNGDGNCMDRVDETFEVNQAIGRKTCDWLVNNQINFGYLCELVRVAIVCPLTCNFCDFN